MRLERMRHGRNVQSSIKDRFCFLRVDAPSDERWVKKRLLRRRYITAVPLAGFGFGERVGRDNAAI